MLTLLVTFPVAATPYHSDAGHYTVELPAGWATVPPDQNHLVGLYSPLTLGGVRTVDACFRPSEIEGIVPIIACMVVEPYPGGRRPSFVLRPEVQTDHSDSVPGHDPLGLHIDPKARTFQSSRVIPVVASLNAQANARGWFGRDAVVTFCTTSVGNSTSRYESTLRQIGDSFRFDSHFDASRPGLLLPALTLSAVAVIIIGLARSARDSMYRDSETKHPR